MNRVVCPRCERRFADEPALVAHEQVDAEARHHPMVCRDPAKIHTAKGAPIYARRIDGDGREVFALRRPQVPYDGEPPGNIRLPNGRTPQRVRDQEDPLGAPINRALHNVPGARHGQGRR